MTQKNVHEEDYVKRLSRSFIPALLVTLLALVLIGCQTTPKVEVIEPIAPVIEPAPVVPVAVEVEVVPEVVVEVPVVEEVPVDVVVHRPPVLFPPVVKSDDGYREFDVYIAHTNDILGSFEDGIGMARLATGVEFGRSLTNKTLLLDAGNI